MMPDDVEEAYDPIHGYIQDAEGWDPMTFARSSDLILGYVQDIRG